MSRVLRHGFKSEAERLALDIRRELALGPFDLLEPKMLADHLGIPVVSLQSLRRHGASQDSITHLTSSGLADFSAMTVVLGTFRLIVENPVHSNGRRANSAVHELSGFYPARADTSEKAHLGPGGVSWQSEGSTARSLNVRRSG